MGIPYLSFTTCIVTLTVVFLVQKIISFAKNYSIAARTGYPVFITPVFSRTVVWMILGPQVRPHFERWLPRWIYLRFAVPTGGWEFRLGAEMHAALGKCFVVVSPDECSLWIADPDVANVVLAKRKEFMQDPIVKLVVNLAGPNLLGADGDDWQRQRRLVAPNLNERISESVWKESRQQSRLMLKYLVDHPGNKTIDGLRNVAINVLGHSGYGQTQPWSAKSHADTKNSDKEDMSYFKAISLVTIMLMEAALLSPKFMKLPFMPASLHLLGHAMENLPRYTNDLLNRDRKATADGGQTRANLLSMMVQLSDQEKSGGKTGLSLTEAEISGNLFLFSAAGFDTTANTMGYAVTLLAAHPEWQDWIKEELQDLDEDVENWVYEDTFPKCKRVLAVMFETLRLFTPVLHTIRAVYAPQTITDSQGTHLLNFPMTVYVNSHAMHHDPVIWGADVRVFKPSRWIDPSTGNIITPPKGTFLPWSGGPRVCPGMKMAQVEFVATFSTLFRAARCVALRDEGVTAEEESKRLKELMADSMLRLTLQMQNSQEVRLKWIKDGP